MILSSLSEIVSIGAIFPFIGILIAPDKIYQHSLMEPIIQLLDITNSSQLLLPLTITFILTALLAGTIRLALLYVMTRLSHATGSDLSINVYSRTLYQDYSIHVERNSSRIIDGIINKTNAVTSITHSVLLMLSSIMLIISIIVALLVIDIAVALVLFFGFGLIYLGLTLYTRKQLKGNSQCIAENSTFLIKSLQEGLGGIRDVLVNGSQQFYCQLYKNADLPLRRASGNNLFISMSPRYVIEAIGMALLAVLAYSISQQSDGLVSAIPTLGAIALCSQRLLPSIQQFYASYSGIKGSNSSFEDVLTLLDQPLPNYVNQPKPIPIIFGKKICIKNLSFRYTKNSPWILKNINLTFARGTRIGFMGVTGCGKSTLLDIIMGLLSPSKGELLIDNQPITRENLRSWQAHIAHVSQNIFLSDSTIEENIALGIPKELINSNRIKKVAKQAQIAEMIEGWEDGYQTFVGERGIRLSGGQRQRIGIARALYKQSNVLIFDEATSALDLETEQAVMEAIAELDRELTILIIAHRLTSLNGCDQIVKLDNNGNMSITKIPDSMLTLNHRNNRA